MSDKDLWSRVDKTDPKFTKKVNQRGGFTSIDATYQAKKASEQFGPYGMGWGLSEIEYNYDLLASTGLVICKATFFYIIDDKRAEFPIHNAIKAVAKDRADEDFCKKLETNTVSKALAKLGFCADVFMGQFEDRDYLAEATTRSDIDRADEKDAVISEKNQELIDYTGKNLKGIEHAPSDHAAHGIYQVAFKHLQRQSQIPEVRQTAEAGLNRLNEELAKRTKA